jgi:hypothetical protein
MTVFTVASKDYAKMFRATEAKRNRAVHTAVQEAAMLGVTGVVVPAIRESVHRYTGALIGSARAVKVGEGAEIRVDAPHAGVIEGGARPHMPPLQPILDWVRVNYAFFGLTKSKLRRNDMNPPRTERQARSRDWSALVHGMFEASVLEIANALRWKIYRHGSVPHWYMRNSLPKLRDVLKATVSRRMADDGRT